jgi:type III secretory pathway component EscS
LVRIAEPVNISRWAAFHEADGWDVVRQFTDDVAAQLRTVSPSYESWQQAEQLSRIAEVVVRSPEDDLPAHVNLADREEVAQKLASLEAECGDRLLGLMASFAEYERDLTLLGLSDAQVVAKYPQGKLRGSLVWSLVKVLVALPIAAVGVVIHLIPFQIMKQLAKRPTNEGIKATVKLLGCVVLFAVTYALLGYFMARAFGAWFGLLAALAAPFCGYVAVRMAERIKRIGGLVDGYRTVRGRNAVLATVFSHRTAVVDAVRQLLASK